MTQPKNKRTTITPFAAQTLSELASRYGIAPIDALDILIIEGENLLSYRLNRAKRA